MQINVNRNDRLQLVSLVCLLFFVVLTGCGRQGKLQDSTTSSSVAVGSRQMTLVDIELVDRPGSLVDTLAAKQDSTADSWDTEVLGQQLDGQLKTIASWIVLGSLPAKELGQVVAADFRSTGLRPTMRSLAYRQSGIVVQREKEWTKQYDKHSGFREALEELGDSLARFGEIRAKFKLFRIEQAKNSVNARVYFEASSHGKSSHQNSATWDTMWLVSNDAPPLLAKVEVSDFEESEYAGAEHMFADVTKAVLGKNKSYEEQVVPGIPYWMDRMSREFMSQFGHHGLAVGDVNGDGLDDLYVCDTGGLPNRLYLHQPDGTVVDASAESGVDLLEDSVGCLLVDLDNDGDQDLVVATNPLLQFAENDGTGKFEIKRGFYANTDSYSLTAADYDNDGDVDVYVCGYNARKQDPVSRGLPFPVPYHDANNGGENHLFRNDGEFVFADVTKQVGLEQNNTRFSLAASWEDYDDDGDMDLYVANDFGRNCLFRNDDGSFVDVAANAGVEDHASGMSVSWSDFNRDGKMDVYVSNMFSAAGNRVTFQRKFTDGLADSTVSNVQRMARGNTLFAADGQGGFRDVSERFAVTMGRWAWSSRFADLNNDGWQDLLVANGYVTNEDTSDL